MKKHIIAVAVAAAVAVPAMAQNVSVYGRLDVGYGSLDNKLSAGGASGALSIAGLAPSTATAPAQHTGSIKSIGYGIDQTAMWGFRGSEDLGGGLKASFTIETGIAGANSVVAPAVTASGNSASGQTYSNATSIGGRLLFASIANSTGTEVRVGYQSTFVRDVGVGFAADGATNVSGNAVAFAFAPRANQIALLQTSGSLTLGASYSKQTTNDGASADDTETGTGYQLSARYASGPLAAQAVYARNSNAVAAATTERVATTYIAGASYDFGGAQGFAQYGNIDNVTGPKANDPAATLWNVGLRVPMGNLGLFASYSGGENRATAGGYNGDVVGYNLGARYAFSKRTNAYGIYGKLTVDTAAAADQSLKMWGIGLTHLF